MTILIKSEKVVRVKATKDRKAHVRHVSAKSEIDKVNRVYNQLCSEMGIAPTFISDLGRLKQRIDELKQKARKNPGSMFYMS